MGLRYSLTVCLCPTKEVRLIYTNIQYIQIPKVTRHKNYLHEPICIKSSKGQVMVRISVLAFAHAFSHCQSNKPI